MLPLMNTNPYKQLSDDIIKMTQDIQDKVYASDLEDRLIELAHEGPESPKEYEEINV